MKKIILYIYLLVPFLGMAQAIQFRKLAGGIGNNGFYTPVRTIFYDTIDKKLYAGGQFVTADGKTVWGAAVWSNNVWDSLKGGLAQFPQLQPSISSSSDSWARKIVRFQNKIYFAGAIEWVNGKNQYHLGIWNGINWDYPIPQPPNGEITDLKVYDNTLYACGYFTKFGSTTCNYIAKFDGNSWQPVGDFTQFSTTPPAAIRAIAIYNNEIYVAGAFDDSSGMPKNIAKFNGTEWVNVGTGIQQGGIAWVESLEEFDNRLYIGGYFHRTQQNPGEALVSWNGTAFEDVKSDILIGTFRSFYRSRDKLFILANFYDNNHNAIPGIKYVSKEKQCEILHLETTFTNTLNYSLDCMASINDSLIVGGLFKYLDTLQANSIGVITNYESSSNCLFVALQENSLDNFIKVYPNPVSDNLYVELQDLENSTIQLQIVNSIGQIQFYSKNVIKQNIIDLSAFPSGLYFLKLWNTTDQKIYKIIKE